MSSKNSIDLKNVSIRHPGINRTCKLVCVLFPFMVILGCNPFESTFEKQVKTCKEDVKLGLNDPDSLEITSTNGFEIKNGGYRIQIDFTAKNAFGGRVRGDAICGFKDKSTTELNPDDFMNTTRKISRDLRSLGIK
jgi:hypothetical protein